MNNERYRILLIEDDKLDQLAFTQMVKDKKLPYDCVTARSVSQAHNILGTREFDVIIADYSLGDGTAFDIMDSAGGTPVIFVTGAGNEEVAVKAFRAGASDYLIKDHKRNYLKTLPITVENVVRHKKMEGELRLLSGAIMCTDECIYITDMEDRIIFVNRAFCETYGYKQEEVIGKYANILCRENPISVDARNIYKAVGSREVGFHHKRKDGSEFPVFLSRSVIKDENDKGIALVGISRDILKGTFIEEKIRSLNLKLKKDNQRMS